MLFVNLKHLRNITSLDTRARLWEHAEIGRNFPRKTRKYTRSKLIDKEIAKTRFKKSVPEIGLDNDV